MKKVLVLLCMMLMFTGCSSKETNKENSDIEQEVSNNNNENSDTEQDSITEEIYINDIYLDDEDCIIDDELFWTNITISIVETGELQDYYASMDLDGNIHAKIKVREGYQFYERVSSEKIALMDENGIIVVDENSDLTSTYCTGNEYIKLVQKDDTGITIWVQEDVETFEKNESNIKALDENGNVKFEVSTDDLKESYGFTWCEFRELFYIGGTTYKMDDCGKIEENYSNCYDGYFNIDGVSTFAKDDKSTSTDSASSDGEYTMESEGHSVAIWDKNAIVTYDSSGNWITAESSIGNGLFYCVLGSGWNSKYCIMDYKGDVVFYLEDVRNTPYYHNGSAPISIISANGDGIPYTTFMDTSGNWLFEPVEGDYKSYIKSLNMCTVLQKDNYICFLDKNGKKWCNYEDVSFYAQRNNIYYYVFWENGELDVVEFVEK